MIGLEINENIKLVDLRETEGGPTLWSYNISSIEAKPTDADRDDAVSRSIEKIVSQAEIGDTDVCTVVSGSMLQMRRVALPPMPDADLQQAVRLEAHNFTTFQAADTVIDYFVIEKAEGKESRKLDVMITAVEKNSFKRLLSIISHTGLRCCLVTVPPFALKEVLTAQPSFSKDELTAVLDLGIESAGLSLFKGEVPQFFREIDMGDQLPNEVLSSFTYYREQFLEEKIVRLYLSGETARIKNIQESLSASSGIPVEIIDPLRNLKLGPKIDAAKLSEDAPRLAMVIGLAKNRAGNLNLVKIKEKAPKKRIDTTRAIENISIPNALVIAFLVFILAVIAGLNLYLGRSLESTKKELAVKSLKLDQLTNYQERKATYEEIRGKRTEVKTILGQIAKLLPAGTVLLDLSFDNQKKMISLSGETKSPVSASAFTKNLDRSEEFDRVKLKEIKKTGKVAIFSMEFFLKSGGAVK